MDSSPTSTPTADTLSPAMGPFVFDFTYSSMSTSIKNKDTGREVYKAKLHLLSMKNHITYHGADGDQFATCTLPTVKINVACNVRGKPIELHATKKFKTSYVYSSPLLSERHGRPVDLRWETTAHATQWDYHCLDEQQLPLARLRINIKSLKNDFARLEFDGDAARDRPLAEEILVAGFSLYVNMLLRMNNLLSLAGAVFHRTSRKPVGQAPGSAQQEPAIEMDKRQA